MKRAVVFFHGWGCNRSIWDKITTLLPEQIDAVHFDRGYFGLEQTQISHEQPRIFVTHSMGVLHAAPFLQEKDTLLVVNGFSAFVPSSEAAASVKASLKAMRLRLLREPAAMLRDFWKAAGIVQSDKAMHEISVSLLQEDLDQLANMSAPVQVMRNLDDLVFVHSRDDMILHPHVIAETEQLFPDRVHLFTESGGHALPQTMCRVISDRILSML